MPASAAEKEQPAVRFAKDQLKAFVERIEKLEEEKKAISDDIRDVYAESKANGFDVTVNEVPSTAEYRQNTGCRPNCNRVTRQW